MYDLHATVLFDLLEWEYAWLSVHFQIHELYY